VSERLLEMLVPGLVLAIADVMIARYCYQSWFRFPEFQQKLISRNERYAEDGWPFFAWGNRYWIAQPNFKPFARLISLLVLLGFTAGLIVWFVYMLLPLITGQS
jgi:hypothetical protein